MGVVWQNLGVTFKAHRRSIFSKYIAIVLPVLTYNIHLYVYVYLVDSNLGDITSFNMGQPSQKASNAIIYVTYAAFLYVENAHLMCMSDGLVVTRDWLDAAYLVAT